MFLASFSPSTSRDLENHPFCQLLGDKPVSRRGVLVGDAWDVISQGPAEHYLGWQPVTVLLGGVAVL